MDDWRRVIGGKFKLRSTKSETNSNVHFLKIQNKKQEKVNILIIMKICYLDFSIV
jgi:hypothetical protein